MASESISREYLEHKLNYVLGAASLSPEQMAKRKECLIDDLMVIIDPERRALEQAVVRDAIAWCAWPHRKTSRDRLRASVYELTALMSLDAAPAPDQGARER